MDPKGTLSDQGSRKKTEQGCELKHFPPTFIFSQWEHIICVAIHDAIVSGYKQMVDIVNQVHNAIMPQHRVTEKVCVHACYVALIDMNKKMIGNYEHCE